MTQTAASEAPLIRPVVLNKTMVLETNHACNLRCIHCYVPDHSKRRRAFLDPGLAESLFDQFEECGFNYVLFTGGEPLLHPHFDALYSSAWERGFHVSLFTNALLLDEARLDLLTRKPPAVVRVSLFGGDPESYASVAGRDGHRAALRGIFALQERGLPVRVKIPLLRPNAAGAARAQAELRRRGIPAKVDVRIIPRFDHDRDVLAFRLEPEEILAQGLDDTQVNLEKFRELKRRRTPGARTLRYCLEHCQPFLIDPSGRLQLCFFIRDLSVDLGTTRLRQAILRLAEAILQADLGEAPAACDGCAWAGFCTYCPGWARNEVGRAGAAIPFLCRTAGLFSAKYEALDAASAASAGGPA